MLRSFRFLAILACALPLACADTSNTPTATAPAPRFIANPASNGSVILKFNDWTGWFWVGWYDPGLDVIGAVAGFDFVAACAGQDPAVLPSDWKVVQSNKVYDLYHSIATMPEVYIFIYDGDWAEWSFCKPPIMRGTGTARLTDNDRSTTGERVANGANAWGLMTSGQVTDGNGQAYRYSGHVRGVANPNGGYKEELLINLKPLP